MKKILVLVAATFMLLLAGGCANMPGFGIAPDRMEVPDTYKMQVIEKYAKQSGMRVIWMREPTKLVDRPPAGS